jgi:hypothetical protein
MSLNVYDLTQVREDLEIAETKWASQQLEFQRELTDLETEHKSNVAKLEKQLQDERTRYSELKQDLDSIHQASRDEALKNINRLKTILNKGKPVLQPPPRPSPPPAISSLGFNEEGNDFGHATTMAIPEEGYPPNFFDRPISQPPPPPPRIDPIVTLALGEDFPGIDEPEPGIDVPHATTLAIGEEGGPSTERLGEEGHQLR